MQVKKSSRWSFLLLAAGFIVVHFSFLKAAVPTTFSYQGSLKQNGSPVNGTYVMEFRLTNQAGTDVYWAGGPRNVDVLEGLYRVELNLSSVDWANIDPYIETRVSGTVLLPREKVNTTPYAGMAKTVTDGAIDAAKIAPLAVTNAKVNDVAAAKITGQINSSQIADATVTDAKIAGMAASKLSGDLALDVVNALSHLRLAGIETLPILQIKKFDSTTQFFTQSTSFVPAMSGTVTPKRSNSLFLIFASGDLLQGSSDIGYVTIGRNGTNLASSAKGFHGVNSVSSEAFMFTTDTPSTTSPVVYSIMIRTNGGGPYANFLPGGTAGTIIVVEVAQ